MTIAAVLASLMGITSTVQAQLPQDGRAFNFLNSRGKADPGRPFNFLSGHGYANGGDPGRTAPVTAARVNPGNTIDRSLTGFRLSGTTFVSTATGTSGPGTTLPAFVVHYPGYGYSFFPGYYYNYGLYTPSNPYSYGLIPGIPVGTFVPPQPQP